MLNWNKLNILITGGTGSFGKKFIEVMLKEYHPARLCIYSRDELKQHEMLMGGFDHPSLRYFIGDVRDAERMRRAMQGIDVVIHAAALKQVPACEYNPMEAIMTNVMGSRNVIEAALDTDVKRVICISTDKAVNPINLYGSTKLTAEKLFVQSNAYSGDTGSKFSCVRYGNLVGSRGSVIPLFIEQRKTGKLTVTDKRMTRFWITLDQGVHFVIRCMEIMHGGEVFIPKIPSMNIMDLAAAIAPECEIENIGIRPGEKLHEAMISVDEARQTRELEDMFVVTPSHTWWKQANWSEGKPLPENYTYSSEVNTEWLTTDQLKAYIA